MELFTELKVLKLKVENCKSGGCHQAGVAVVMSLKDGDPNESPEKRGRSRQQKGARSRWVRKEGGRELREGEVGCLAKENYSFYRIFL